jgi:hypothetical protein
MNRSFNARRNIGCANRMRAEYSYDWKFQPTKNFNGKRFNAAAISNAFADAGRFRHCHVDAFAPRVTIRQTDLQFKIIGAAVVRPGTIKPDKSRHFDRQTLFDVGRFQRAARSLTSSCA